MQLEEATKQAGENAAKAHESTQRLHDDIELDEDGYPIIFKQYLNANIEADDDGFPTIVGQSIELDPERAKANEEQLPQIRPINPNVRARKLANLKIAKLQAPQSKKVKGAHDKVKGNAKGSHKARMLNMSQEDKAKCAPKE